MAARALTRIHGIGEARTQRHGH